MLYNKRGTLQPGHDYNGYNGYMSTAVRLRFPRMLYMITVIPLETFTGDRR